MAFVLTVLVFAVAYSVKGGWLHASQLWADFCITYPKAAEVLTPKLITLLIVFFWSLGVSFDLLTTVLVTVAWVVSVHPSMGEEAGAIGRIGYWWGDYKDAKYTEPHALAGTPVFDRGYGVSKGVQRGAWIGAVFTVIGSPSLSIVIMAIGFPFAHFVFQELHHRIRKSDSWVWAEPAIGALIGLCAWPILQ